MLELEPLASERTNDVHPIDFKDENDQTERGANQNLDKDADTTHRNRRILLRYGGFLAIAGLGLFLYGLADFLGLNEFHDVYVNQKEEPSPKETRRKRPNVLLITTDQQRFDAIRRVQDELQHYSNVTKIRTPNLDKLSRDGVYFRNAYTQCSVCGPARGTLRTGCTIERTGLQSNGIRQSHLKSPWFDQRVRELTTIDKVLTDNGYTSENYGKWHLPDLFWQYVTYNNYDYKTEKFTHEKDGVIANMYKRFIKVFQKAGKISTALQDGMQMDPQTNTPYTPIALDPRYGFPPGTELTPENGFDHRGQSETARCGESALDHEYSQSHFIGKTSLKALKRLKEQEKPFFLTVSFTCPHPPFIATRKHHEYYKNQTDNLFFPRSLYDPMKNSAYGFIASKLPNYRNHTLMRQWAAVYYAMIEEVDDLIGDLLTELGDHRENTLVIFTSDHGEMLGAHGKRSKNTFYEEANHIPFFISFPGVIEPETTVDEPVSHLDLFGTILDYVGLSEFDDSDGTSLRPKIEKRSYNMEYDEDMVVGEWDYRDPIVDDSESIASNKLTRELDTDVAFMVRKGRYKLMVRKASQSAKVDMMIDLNEDPFEMNNLLGSNGPTAPVETLEKAEHLRCLLLDWMQRMDGGEKRYYSDPFANGGEGLGDIEEVRLRQSWPALDFWKSDAIVEMGRPVWNGTHYTRNEFVYFGRRTPGQGLVKRISLDGENAGLFRVEVVGGTGDVILLEKQCVSLMVSFAIEKLDSSSNFAASIRLRLEDESGGDDAVHTIVLQIKATTPS